MASDTTNTSLPAFPGFPPPPLCSSNAYWTVARILTTFTLVTVIVTNVLLLIVTWRAKDTRINFVLFSSLGMASLLTGIFVLPFNVVFAFQAQGAFPGYLMCTFNGLMFHILQTIQLFSFFGLSLDRLFSIIFPFEYLNFMTPTVIIIDSYFLCELMSVLCEFLCELITNFWYNVTLPTKESS